jgi:hypothetical protein
MTDAPFHDTGYKALFSLPELVQQLIEGFVTPDIAQLLDFSTLELVAGSFVTPAMQSREEDVVWRGEDGRHDAVPVSAAGVSVHAGRGDAGADGAVRGGAVRLTHQGEAG